METCVLCKQEFNDPRGYKGLCPVCYLRCRSVFTDPGCGYDVSTDHIDGVGVICYIKGAETQTRTEIFIFDHDEPGPIPIDVSRTCANGTVFVTDE
jgi:hypothetical protein